MDMYDKHVVAILRSTAQQVEVGSQSILRLGPPMELENLSLVIIAIMHAYQHDSIYTDHW